MRIFIQNFTRKVMPTYASLTSEDQLSGQPFKELWKNCYSQGESACKVVVDVCSNVIVLVVLPVKY